MIGGHGASTSSASTGLPVPIALLPYSDADAIGTNPSVDKRVRLCEDKMNRYTSVEDTKFNLMEEQVNKTLLDVEGMKVERERVWENKKKEINKLGDSMNQKVNALIRNRQEKEVDEEDKIFSDLATLESEVKQLRLERKNAQGTCAKKLGEEIAAAQAELGKVKELRMQQGERIANVVHDELIQLHNKILAIKESRVESEKERMKMIEEMCYRIRTEVDNERELRQHGEEQLLQLLEETCNRVEANFQLAGGSMRGAH